MTWPTEPMVAPNHGAVPIEAPTQAPDFSRWSRANLEKLATDLNNECLQLKADLRLALDAHRANLVGKPADPLESMKL